MFCPPSQDDIAHMSLAQLKSSINWLECLNNTISFHRLKCSHQDPLRAITIPRRPTPETVRSTPVNEIAMACAESVAEGSAKINRSRHNLGAKWLVKRSPPIVVARNVLTIPRMSAKTCFFSVCFEVSFVVWGGGFRPLIKSAWHTFFWELGGLVKHG